MTTLVEQILVEHLAAQLFAAPPSPMLPAFIARLPAPMPQTLGAFLARWQTGAPAPALPSPAPVVEVLGIGEKEAERRLKERGAPTGNRNAAKEKQENRRSDRTFESPIKRGDNAAYKRARLTRDFPVIARKLAAGEYPSVAAAWRAAKSKLTRKRARAPRVEASPAPALVLRLSSSRKRSHGPRARSQRERKDLASFKGLKARPCADRAVKAIILCKTNGGNGCADETVSRMLTFMVDPENLSRREDQ